MMMCVVTGFVLVITFLTAQIGVIWCSDVDFAVKAAVICGIASTCISFIMVLVFWFTANCYSNHKQIQEDADTNRLIDQFMDFKSGVYDRLHKEEIFKKQMDSSDEDDTGSQNSDDENEDADDEHSPREKKDL